MSRYRAPTGGGIEAKAVGRVFGPADGIHTLEDLSSPTSVTQKMLPASHRLLRQ